MPEDKSLGRKLLLLFDGSSNSTARADESSATVIYRLNQAFSNGRGGEQISFYYSGVGTRGDHFSAVTGEGLNQIIADAYINLSSNYVEGDLIYLFGFSRGAVAARCLSGLLSNVGLLYDSKLAADFPKVWEAYSQMTNPNKQKKVDQIRRGLEEDLHHPPVRFLGAFDSVPGDKWDKLKLVDCHAIQDFKLAKNVEHAVHILSVDDNRHPSFEPLLWEGKARNDQFLRQIWMPGVHADVGGCSNSVFIGNLAALTMIELLQEKCPELLFDNDYIDGLEKSTFDPNLILQITNERPDFWRRLLGRKLRSAKGGAEQAKHHLLSQLVGRPLNIRGKNRQYCAKHITSIVKTTHHTRYDMRIDDALEGYGPRQQCCEHC